MPRPRDIRSAGAVGPPAKRGALEDSPHSRRLRLLAAAQDEGGERGEDHDAEDEPESRPVGPHRDGAVGIAFVARELAVEPAGAFRADVHAETISENAEERLG